MTETPDTSDFLVGQQLQPSVAIRITELGPSCTLQDLTDLTGLAPQQVLLAGPRGERQIVLSYRNPDRNYLVDAQQDPCGDGVIGKLAGISLQDPRHWWSEVDFARDALELFARPVTSLMALCHPENFPLPRFALGISDIAASLRGGAYGQVHLMDMQVGETVESMVSQAVTIDSNIVGVSVTFGQQDLLETLLDEVARMLPKALVVVGGSLAALNSQAILRRYPRVLVAKGAGELTMRDVVEYWRGERRLPEIHDIEFAASAYADTGGRSRPVSVLAGGARLCLPVAGDGSVRRTDRRVDDRLGLPLPELDLLPATLRQRGVMQLESSRGCTFACSFCPRDHKGMWFGPGEGGYGDFLSAVAEIFKRHPDIARKIFLVDEEFFGYKPGAEERVMAIAETMHTLGFSFETSARVDQVYRPREDSNWQANRVRVWRQLVARGLDRCLFGIESGVDSILSRFRKKTTARQNAVAARILSLAGVPVRFTYITFDPLMSMAELVQTYRFQGRTDLWLRPAPNITDEMIVRIALDDDGALSHASGIPFYQQIPYLLVSMECLVGSDYLKEVERAGLAGDENLLMGRREAAYADPLIGCLSRHAQMWIDRSFALDYTLKSLIKVSQEPSRTRLRSLRGVLKSHAYRLLGMMLVVANNDTGLEANPGDGMRAIRIALGSGWHAGAAIDVQAAVFQSVMNSVFEEFVEAITAASRTHRGDIDPAVMRILDAAIKQWERSREWSLINGAK